MKRSMMLLGPIGIAFIVSGCAFSSTARNWNGLKGLDDQPTYYLNTTKVGMNLFIVVPCFGDMGIAGLTRDMTEKIKEQGGNDVRIVQGDSESYFYGWPPFTWIITPVISTVAAEYTPSAEVYARDQEKIAKIEAEGGTTRWYKPWSW
jgi:hypothetical protein